MDDEWDEISGSRVCPRCGAAFVCGVAAGAERCWCFELPPVMAVRADTACLCPACLFRAIHGEQEQIVYPKEIPSQ
jgi:hypothetical protein